jgi:hypothetical protein
MLHASDSTSLKKQNWQHNTLHMVLCADKLGNKNLGLRSATNIRYEPRDSFRIRILRICFMCLWQQHAQLFIIKHTPLASDNKRSQFLFLEKKWQHKTFDMVTCAEN